MKIYNIIRMAKGKRSMTFIYVVIAVALGTLYYLSLGAPEGFQDTASMTPNPKKDSEAVVGAFNKVSKSMLKPANLENDIKGLKPTERLLEPQLKEILTATNENLAKLKDAQAAYQTNTATTLQNLKTMETNSAALEKQYKALMTKRYEGRRPGNMPGSTGPTGPSRPASS